MLLFTSLFLTLFAVSYGYKKWFFKSRLPVGVEEFDEWANSVIALTPLPNNESIHFALATIILELDKSEGRISKQKMADLLTKAAANQVAAYVFQKIKTDRIEKDKQTAAEIVPPTETPVSSNGI